MAHYAILDESNTVILVFAGRDENDLADGVTSWEDYYGNVHGRTCLRTSYNTHGNQHPNGTPFRGNYAGIGYTYDPDRDAFIPPEPPDSTGFDEDTLTWIVPELEEPAP